MAIHNKRTKLGPPSLEERYERKHIEAYIRSQFKMADGVQKATEMLDWLLNDLHECNNPANKGRSKKDIINNPKYDCTKSKSIDNPMFIEVEVPLYDPKRYKENTVTNFLRTYLTNNATIYNNLQKATTTSESEEEKPTGWSAEQFIDLPSQGKPVN